MSNVCEICKKYEATKNIGLSGTDDFYQLEVCVDCYNTYGCDYLSPEDVDQLLGGTPCQN